MAYISGTIGNFESRFHQLSTGIVDLSGSANTYWNEGNYYASLPSGAPSTGLQYHWSKMFAAKYYSVTKSGIPYNLNYF